MGHRGYSFFGSEMCRGVETRVANRMCGGKLTNHDSQPRAHVHFVVGTSQLQPPDCAALIKIRFN